ncbi:MAG TPA: alpha-1,4-glucan--maltose-1-phosphate maltosyltransferase [Gemmatimonadaceae bacterium]|nr:alpha-1,4-glucan--maltose-1-phosphate maltosyltransferase [Gemmatimonadaceae bacterium]
MLPRLVIEQVRPAVEAGRYAVKRTVGDTVTVEATVYKDGHDPVTGRVRYRPANERKWRVAPMTYDRDFDRCRGAFTVDRLGGWTFAVDAWTDRFEGWRADVRKKAAAEVALHLDLLNGALMVDEAVAAARGRDAQALTRYAAAIRDDSRSTDDRVADALSPDLDALMGRHLPPADLIAADGEFPVWVDRPRAAFGAWYELFPRSQGATPGAYGTLADTERQLPRLADLGFDVIYLPPIHPIGITNRKGRNNALVAAPDDVGSPWAIGNAHGGHTAIDPGLGTLDDFAHLVRAARALDLEIALDYALQCSPDHPWVRDHPDWFFIQPDGSIKHAENPPKTYEDIYPPNFWCDDRAGLWNACRDILKFWIDHGVRIFRVDNPHTKPYAFWAWVIAEIHRDHPDVIFLAEAFTRPARMKGLARLGFTQSYTYFTWRNSAQELSEYVNELAHGEMAEYYRPNFFTNTPDILHEYLQDGGRAAFRVRLLLAATLSPVYGIYSGFELCENTPREPGSEEYLHSEKYEIRQRQWDAPGNLNDDLRRINGIRREQPALQLLSNVRFHHTEDGAVLFFHKQAPGHDLLIVVNLDPHAVHETMVHVPVHDLGLDDSQPYDVEDLLTGKRYTWHGSRNYVRLDPAVQPGHLFRVLPHQEHAR